MATTLKHKVTLRTKIAETPIATPVGGNEGNNGKGNGKKWGIAILIVAILAIAAFFLLKGNKSDNNSVQNDVVIEETFTPAEVSVEEAENDVPKTESAPSQEESVAQEDAVHAEPESPDEEVTPVANPSDKAPANTAPKNESVKEVTQSAVNQVSVNLYGSLEEKALQVIRGDFGNGTERREKLGDQYDEIQTKVNEMYRNGLVR